MRRNGNFYGPRLIDRLYIGLSFQWPPVWKSSIPGLKQWYVFPLMVAVGYGEPNKR